MAAGGDHGSGGLTQRLFLDMNDFARHPPWRHTTAPAPIATRDRPAVPRPRQARTRAGKDQRGDGGTGTL
jgi:hypothetical protein